MAIAYVSQASRTDGTGTTVNATFTMPAISNGLLIVGVRNNTGDLVTGVTFNSVAMKLAIKRQSAYSANVYQYLYYLEGATSGSHTIAVSSSSSSSIGIFPAAYSGAKQTQGVGTDIITNSDGGSAKTSLTVAVTTQTDNCWLIGVADADTVFPSAGTGTTSRDNGDTSAPIYDSNGAKTPTGSYSLQITSTSQKMDLLVASFAPASIKKIAGIWKTAPAALAFDAAVNGGNVSSATSLTWNHTVTGTNTCLIVAVVGNKPSDTITGVTYNGVSMTQVTKTAPGNGGDRWSYLYLLTGAATGTNAVVVSSSSNSFLQGGSSSYTGVKQTGQPDANTNSDSVAATSFTISNTSITDGCWTVAYIAQSSAGTLSAGANTSIRCQVYDAGQRIVDSNSLKTPAGSVSLSLSSTSSSDWRGHSVSLAPFDYPIRSIKKISGISKP